MKKSGKLHKHTYPDSVLLQAKLIESYKQMDDLLKEFALGEKKEFTPYAYASEHAITAYFKGDADYSEVLTDGITLYKSMATNEIVGCRINKTFITVEE
jgi:hypothetical protein